MIKHVSNKIQNAIQMELFKAKESIKIAVAWFTNELLLQPLILKLQNGVSVELILNDDEINRGGESSLDFTEFLQAGGILRWNNSKQLMHDKFCIIDNNIVIFGSYNWTNKAEYNEESIAISKCENDTIVFYLKKFESLSSKYPEVAIKDLHKDNIGNEDRDYGKRLFINEMEASSSHSTNNNEPERESIKPYHFAPFSKLHFYDDINVYRLYDKSSLYVIAKNNNRFCFVDPNSLLPIDDIRFTHFAVIGDYSGEVTFKEDAKYLWLETNNKWGLYNTNLKKFVISPIYDSYHIKGQNFDYFVVCINNKYGLVAKSGRILLKCEFEKIQIVDRDERCIVVRNGSYALFTHGQIDYDNKYKYFFSDGKYPIKINGKYGVYGYGAKLILDFVYDNIEYDSNGAWTYLPAGTTGNDFHILTKGGKYGIHLCRTDEITDCIYDSKEELYELFDKHIFYGEPLK